MRAGILVVVWLCCTAAALSAQDADQTLAGRFLRRARQAAAADDWREVERLVQLALALPHDATVADGLQDLRERLRGSGDGAIGAATGADPVTHAREVLAGVLAGDPITPAVWQAYDVLHLADPSDPLLAQVLACQQPSWADACGFDSHGRWAMLPAGRLRVRFRYVPAGTMVRDDGRAVVNQAPFWIGEEELSLDAWNALRDDELVNLHGDRPLSGLPPDELARGITAIDHRLPRARVRLPGSSEWEFAARAGATGPYLPGFTSFAAAAYECAHRPEPGQGLINDFGLRDVHGGMWELCRNQAGNLVRRGGGWRSRRSACALDRVFPLLHQAGDPTLGLRLLIEADG